MRGYPRNQRINSGSATHIMANMTDIAKLSGVSRATVSYVLNRKQRKNPISNATREKVLAAAGQLNYLRDDMARAVASGKSNTIAYVSYSIGITTMAICEQALEYSYSVKLLELESFISHFEALLSKSRIAGVIINHSHADRLMALLSGKNIPAVVINSRTSNPDAVQVHSDEKKATRLLLDHLIAGGRRNICFCCYTLDDYKMNLRYGIYEKIMREREMAPQMLFYDNSAESRKHLISILDDNSKRPDAFIVGNEAAVFSLHGIILGCGLKMPRDIALVSYSDSRTFPNLVPSVSAINEKRYEIGCESVRMLVDAIDGHEIKEKNKIMDVELIIRKSSDFKA